MQVKQLFTDERAVSPVIGVILMVAITVILAAVIGTFVLGLGDQVSQAQPSANIGFSYSSSAPEITVMHKGGDALDESTLQVKVGSQAAKDVSGWKSGNSITAGDSMTIGSSGSPDVSITAPSEGDSVRIIWSADTGDTAIIAEGTYTS